MRSPQDESGGLGSAGQVCKLQQARRNVGPIMLQLQAQRLDLVEQCAQVRGAFCLGTTGPSTSIIMCCHGNSVGCCSVWAMRLGRRAAGARRKAVSSVGTPMASSAMADVVTFGAGMLELPHGTRLHPRRVFVCLPGARTTADYLVHAGGHRRQQGADE